MIGRLDGPPAWGWGRPLTDAETREWQDRLSGEVTAEYEAESCALDPAAQHYRISVDPDFALDGVPLDPLDVCIPSATESPAAQALAATVDRLCVSIVEGAVFEGEQTRALADAADPPDDLGP